MTSPDRETGIMRLPFLSRRLVLKVSLLSPVGMVEIIAWMHAIWCIIVRWLNTTPRTSPVGARENSMYAKSGAGNVRLSSFFFRLYDPNSFVFHHSTPVGHFSRCALMSR